MNQSLDIKKLDLIRHSPNSFKQSTRCIHSLSNNELKRFKNIKINPLRKNILIRNYSSDDSREGKINRKEDHDDKNVKKEMKEQLQEKGNVIKGLIKKYGASALIVYTAISIVDLAFFYGLISAGVDLNGIAEAIGFPLVGKSEKGVTLAVAYACHKLFLPFRLGLAVYITPKVHPYYKKALKYIKERDD